MVLSVHHGGGGDRAGHCEAGLSGDRAGLSRRALDNPPGGPGACSNTNAAFRGAATVVDRRSRRGIIVAPTQAQPSEGQLYLPGSMGSNASAVLEGLRPGERTSTCSTTRNSNASAAPGGLQRRRSSAQPSRPPGRSNARAALRGPQHRRMARLQAEGSDAPTQEQPSEGCNQVWAPHGVHQCRLVAPTQAQSLGDCNSNQSKILAGTIAALQRKRSPSGTATVQPPAGCAWIETLQRKCSPGRLQLRASGLADQPLDAAPTQEQSPGDGNPGQSARRTGRSHRSNASAAPERPRHQGLSAGAPTDPACFNAKAVPDGPQRESRRALAPRRVDTRTQVQPPGTVTGHLSRQGIAERARSDANAALRGTATRGPPRSLRTSGHSNARAALGGLQPCTDASVVRGREPAPT
jgi:hypothetical protein